MTRRPPPPLSFHLMRLAAAGGRDPPRGARAKGVSRGVEKGHVFADEGGGPRKVMDTWTGRAIHLIFKGFLPPSIPLFWLAGDVEGMEIHFLFCTNADFSPGNCSLVAFALFYSSLPSPSLSFLSIEGHYSSEERSNRTQVFLEGNEGGRSTSIDVYWYPEKVSGYVKSMARKVNRKGYNYFTK